MFNESVNIKKTDRHLCADQTDIVIVSGQDIQS